MNALSDAYATGDSVILVPTCNATRGNPVLFDVPCFDVIAEAISSRTRRLHER